MPDRLKLLEDEKTFLQVALLRERELSAARFAEMKRLALRCFQLRQALEATGADVPEIEVSHVG
jgi:hypothetical protein